MEQAQSEQQPFKPKNQFVNLLFVNRNLSQVTFIKTISVFSVIGIIFIALAITFYVQASKIIEVTKQYYDPNSSDCVIGGTCNIPLIVPKDMPGTVYFMYQLGNFYQNHRRYIQSKSNYQLAGNTISYSDAQLCSPFITNGDLGVTKSYSGTPLNPGDVANPCGAIAYTFFTDSFQIFDSNNNLVSMSQTGISWPGDKGGKYKRCLNSSNVQWVDPENQHFIVWMRTSGIPNFKKLWGRIESGLKQGSYTVRVYNNYNSTNWNGNRQFILTTLGPLGGKNFLLPTAFLVLGILSISTGIFFYWKKINTQTE